MGQKFSKKWVKIGSKRKLIVIFFFELGMFCAGYDFLFCVEHCSEQGKGIVSYLLVHLGFEWIVFDIPKEVIKIRLINNIP